MLSENIGNYIQDSDCILCCNDLSMLASIDHSGIQVPVLFCFFFFLCELLRLPLYSYKYNHSRDDMETPWDGLFHSPDPGENHYPLKLWIKQDNSNIKTGRFP